jgi:hypothetical protein
VLEFREHYVGSQHIVDVYIIQKDVPPIKAGELRQLLGEYWYESTAVCYELDELVMMAAKLKELKNA